MSPPRPAVVWRGVSFRLGLTLLVGIVGVSFAGIFIPDPLTARAAGLSIVCLALWLGEVVPAFLPTLLLLALAPLLLGDLGPGLELRTVLGWAADPVLLLFFGGFVLGEAASEHGIDRQLAERALRFSGGRARRLVVLVSLVTAGLSMWMSNIAAAALMIASIRPLTGTAIAGPDGPPRGLDPGLFRALLVAIAMGANLGGMATPIGSGPNAIAIAAMPEEHPITFAAWMAFAIPLVVLSLAVALGIIVIQHRVAGSVSVGLVPSEARPGERPLHVATLGGIAILAWLTEPLHGVSAPTVSLLLATALFMFGLVPAARLRGLDWGTLILIAGGLALGQLVEHTGLLGLLGPLLGDSDAPGVIRITILLFLSALLSAVMSNTATATLLIPVALAAGHGGPALPVLVALAASFGLPFVVSTPPNAMAAGAGARASDLLLPGLILLVLGVLVLAVSGPAVLAMFGVG